jgi:hypothetical protein
MNREMPNINVVRSVWRRVKKTIKVRDLTPVKDAKGGSGFTGESKPITGGTHTTVPQAATNKVTVVRSRSEIFMLPVGQLRRNHDSN